MIPNYVLLALANHLWQCTATAAAIGLLAWILRRNAAQIRYWLWMLASLKFLVPISLLISVGTYLRPVAPAPTRRPVVSALLGQITEPFSRTVSANLQSTGATVTSTPDAIFSSERKAHIIQLSAGAVWLFGCLAVLMSWCLPGGESTRHCAKRSALARSTTFKYSLRNPYSSQVFSGFCSPSWSFPMASKSD